MYPTEITHLKNALKEIREKLGRGKSHIEVGEITFYSNDEGDYWSIEFHKAPGTPKITWYGEGSIEVTQDILHWQPLTFYSAKLVSVTANTKNQVLSPAEERAEMIKKHEDAIKKLREEEDER